MTVKAVKLLSDGFFELDKGFLVYGKASCYGKIYNAALKPLLIITEKNRIIIDTGIGELPEKYRKFYKIKREKNLVRSLKEAGLAPEDISIVINTHLHLDHCGNNALFKSAKFFVQRKELKYARNPDKFQRASYLPELFDKVTYTEIERDQVVEEAVELLYTPGHTPGHQSVVISWKDKKFVYCGDVAPLQENLEMRNVVGILHNPVQALESIDRLRALSNARTKYIYSHDNLQLTL